MKYVPISREQGFVLHAALQAYPKDSREHRHACQRLLASIAPLITKWASRWRQGLGNDHADGLQYLRGELVRLTIPRWDPTRSKFATYAARGAQMVLRRYCQNRALVRIPAHRQNRLKAGVHFYTPGPSFDDPQAWTGFEAQVAPPETALLARELSTGTRERLRRALAKGTVGIERVADILEVEVEVAQRVIGA